MTIPLAAPKAVVAVTASSIAAAGDHGASELVNVYAKTVHERANNDPTDRSIPPQMMTRVMPMAKMPMSEIWRMTFDRFADCQKMGNPSR